MVRFFEPDPAMSLPYTYAIIISRYRDQWIWVQHEDRSTWELPAGHIEVGETPAEAARRELFEETGALKFVLNPIVSYEGTLDDKPVFGMIFLADIQELGPLPPYEIGKIELFDDIPEQLTYPGIQPLFFNYLQKSMNEEGFIELTALPNIGISLAENLLSAGITNPKELFALGTEETFMRIHSHNQDVCISQLYALEGAIRGIRWHELESPRKKELLQFYNQLIPPIR